MRRLQEAKKKKRIDIKMKVQYNYLKPRDYVAKDLRTPKYKMRVVESKVTYTRKAKHKKGDYAEL
jgi:hypothetical protein